jgi:hypothetical protein
MQIDRQGAQVGPILHRRLHFCRKAAPADLLTPWAPHLLHLMLAHHQPRLWQILHLATFLDLSCDPFQGLLTVRTDQGAVTHHLIGARYLHQTVSSMPWLPSRRLLAWMALAPTLASGAIT